MNDTSTNTNTDLGEVTFSRVFDAPRETVFRCMTEPEHLAHFWGPIGMTTPVETISVDLRPGGVFDTVMVNDETGEQYPTHAVFVQIEAPNLLVWSEPEVEGGMTTSISFVDLGDGRTETVIHQTNVPAMFRSPEALAGMQTSFDRFAAYVVTL